MNILKYAFHVTPTSRRAIAALAMVVTLTSTNVQAAQAAEVLPDAPAWTADSSIADETTAERGIIVPPKHPVRVTVAAEVKTEQPAKNKWNTINAADLETKADHSSESAVRAMSVATTAYTSDPGETDASPFTTANGTRVYDGVIAANFLPFGTRVRIPDQFGDKVFVVHDRMNARYTQRVDIWMTNKGDAFKWGVRTVRIEILP